MLSSLHQEAPERIHVMADGGHESSSDSSDVIPPSPRLAPVCPLFELSPVQEDQEPCEIEVDGVGGSTSPGRDENHFTRNSLPRQPEPPQMKSAKPTWSGGAEDGDLGFAGVTDDDDDDFMDDEEQAKFARKKKKRKRAIIKKSSSDSKCPICYGPWTSNGAHRLVNLKCGHLFGQSCIKKWLAAKKSDGKRPACPTCQQPASVRDIRRLFVPTVTVLDVEHLEELKQQMKQKEERYMRRQNEMEMKLKRAKFEARQWQHKFNVAQRQNLESREQLKALQQPAALEGVHQRQQTTPGGDVASATLASSRHQKIPEQTIAGGQPQIFVQRTRFGVQGARVFDFDIQRSALLVSCKVPVSVPSSSSSNASSVSSQIKAGIVAVSLLDPLKQTKVFLHSKEIRDVKTYAGASGSLAGSFLTASLDRKCSIVDPRTNRAMATYCLSNPVWSCCWNGSNASSQGASQAAQSSCFYAGTSRGEVLLFDTRVAVAAGQLPRPLVRFSLASKQGVHSLISLRDGSVLAASMGGASVWDGDRLRSAVYSGEVCQPSSLVEVGPSQASLSIKEAGQMTSASFDSHSSLFLATHRGSRGGSHGANLNVFSVSVDTQQHSSHQCQMTPKANIRGHKCAVSLSRSALFSLSNSPLLAVADASVNQMCLWDLQGRVVQRLRNHSSPLLDVGFHSASKSLVTLTRTEIVLYSLSAPPAASQV